MKTNRPETHSICILLVEHHRAHATAIRKSFRNQERHVRLTVVDTLAHARDALKKSYPDLMIVDAHLPDGSGMELLPGDEARRQFPVIMMSAHGNESLAAKAIKAGALDYVAKNDDTMASMPHTVDNALREWDLIMKYRRRNAAFRIIGEKVEDFLDNLHSVAYMADDLGIIIYANREAARMTGIPTDKLVGTAMLSHLDAASMDAAHAAYHHALSGKSVDVELHCKSGNIVRCNSGPLVGKDGEVIGVVGIGRDVTDRVRTEALLTESQQIARLGSYILDFKTGTWTRSVILADILGIDEEANIAANDWLQFVHPAHHDGVQAHYENDVLAGHEPFDREFQIVRPADGNELWVHGRGRLQFDAGGMPTMMLGTIQDITERKHAEEELAASRKRLAQALEGTVIAFGKTVESRDPYTAGHQARVASLSEAIAKGLGLDEERIKGIRLGAFIHDIGKMQLPAELLSKPIRLSEDEFRLIKQHPRVGYDILKDIDFPWPLAKIVYQHHEHMDGSGYPRGLKGRQICLEARIVAVADVVEAIASHRPYRPALGIEAALHEIRSQRSTRYDKRIVDACLRLFARNQFSFEPPG